MGLRVGLLIRGRGDVFSFLGPDLVTFFGFCKHNRLVASVMDSCEMQDVQGRALEEARLSSGPVVEVPSWGLQQQRRREEEGDCMAWVEKQQRRQQQQHLSQQLIQTKIHLRY